MITFMIRDPQSKDNRKKLVKFFTPGPNVINLGMFIISERVCFWQAFPAKSIPYPRVDHLKGWVN